MNVKYNSIPKKPVEKTIDINEPEYRKDQLSVFRISAKNDKLIIREIFKNIDRTSYWISLVNEEYFDEILEKPVATAEEWLFALNMVSKIINF